MKRYDRVQICDKPRCGHHGGKTGVLDLHGKMEEYPNEDWLAIVLVDGGGACGPYRKDELTLLEPVECIICHKTIIFPSRFNPNMCSDCQPYPA
jgi:hypothetical protein